MDSFEREVARFHRQPALRVAKDSTPEERTERKNANPGKYPQPNKNMIGSKAGQHERNKKAEQVKEMRSIAQHAQGRDDDTETEDESLTEWAKEEEREPEHAKDANAAEIAGGVKEVAHKVSAVAGHVAAGAAVGERLAQGHVVDHSPLARAIRRAAGDFDPTSSARAATSLRPKENTNYAGSGKTKQEYERVEKEYQQHRKAGHSKETAQKLAEE
jgi:hypothetical protein